MIIRKDIDLNKPLTDKQRKMLKELNARPAKPNKNYPALTEKQLSRLAQVHSAKKA